MLRHSPTVGTGGSYIGPACRRPDVPTALLEAKKDEKEIISCVGDGNSLLRPVQFAGIPDPDPESPAWQPRHSIFRLAPMQAKRIIDCRIPSASLWTSSLK